MPDRPPPTRGSRIFGRVAVTIILGGGLAIVFLAILWLMAHLAQGI